MSFARPMFDHSAFDPPEPQHQAARAERAVVTPVAAPFTVPKSSETVSVPPSSAAYLRVTQDSLLELPQVLRRIIGQKAREMAPNPIPTRIYMMGRYRYWMYGSITNSVVDKLDPPAPSDR